MNKATANDAISVFLDQFLKPTKTESPDDLLGRASQWLRIAKRPAELYPDATEYELRCRARQARQNFRRLVNKHPELLVALRAVTEAAG